MRNNISLNRLGLNNYNRVCVSGPAGAWNDSGTMVSYRDKLGNTWGVVGIVGEPFRASSAAYTKIITANSKYELSIAIDNYVDSLTADPIHKPTGISPTVAVLAGAGALILLLILL